MNDPEFANAMIDPSLQTSPGANLAAARQAYGLTVEQIADQLNLAPRQVMALEADDYAALPAAAIARGFLRSYAKLLRLDPVPLVAMLGPAPLPGNIRGSVRPRQPVAQTLPQTETPGVAALAHRNKAVPVVAGITALVAAAIVSYAMGWLPNASSAKNSSDKSNAVVGSRPDSETGSSGTVALGTGASGSAADNVPPGQSIVAGAKTDSLTTAKAPESASVTNQADRVAEVLPAVSIGVLEQSIDGSRLKSAASIAASNPLVLNVRKDSWVEIKRADNTALVATVLKSGSVETYDVSEPLTITIGNAAGVEASLRGAPLELAGNGNGNVARLKLK